MSLDLDGARFLYRHTLSDDDRVRLPFYSALLDELEQDPIALALLAAVDKEHRQAVLVLAALHLAALEGHEELAPIYAAVRSGTPGDPAAAARSVREVLDTDPQLVRRELHRLTQTNEPGRSAVLRAVIAKLASGRSERVNLIDVGSSAGLNLYLDRFTVRDPEHDDGDAFTLVCEDLHGVDRSLEVPAVGHRVGIDIAPLDLAMPDHLLWLRACIWPEERRRHQRLESVVDVLATWPRIEVMVGTGVARLDDALALCQGDDLTIVMDTWSAAYFPRAEQDEFYEMVTQRCATSNVAWVSIESHFIVPWPAPFGEGSSPRSGGSQILVCPPGSTPESWGWCHPHGHWLWLD